MLMLSTLGGRATDLMLLGERLLACLICCISIIRAESSESGGEREYDLMVGSEACEAG